MDPRVERLIKLLAEAVHGHEQALKLRDELAAAIEKARTIDNARAAFKAFDEQFLPVAGVQKERLLEGSKLASDLAATEPQPQPPGTTPKPSAILPANLVKQFRTIIDTAQQEARTPGAGDTAATIKSLDIELKGFIVVEQDQPAILPPQPDKPIDAAQLSTIRMSFGSVPVVRAAPTDTPE